MPIDPDLAARLTLLFLRAAVPTEVPLRPGVCAVGHGTAPVTTSDAARRLAAMPKPLGCYAAVDGDLLVVELRLPERWRQSLTMRQPPHDQEEDPGWYAERYGPDFHSKYVLCVGRGEWSLATFGELSEWHRDFPFLGPGGWRGDDIADLHATERQIPLAAVVAAKERGAVHVQWYGPAYHDDGVTGRIWCTRYEPSGHTVPECERCGVRPARFAVHWFEGARPSRSLCQRCIDEELDSSQFDMARDLDRRHAELLLAERTMNRAELAQLAEEQAMWWALRVTPPFIRDFIARYRLGP